MRINGAGNVCQRAKQIKDAAQRTVNLSETRDIESLRSPARAKQTTDGNTRYGAPGVEAHLYRLTPNDAAGAALLVPGRPAVLIHCKSRFFQPANANTASVNGTRSTAGVVLHLFASASAEAFLKSRSETNTRKRRGTGDATGACVVWYGTTSSSLGSVLHSSSAVIIALVVITWRGDGCLDKWWKRGKLG